MPIRCEACGHIHWSESKSLARYAAWVAGKKPSETFTSRDLADEMDISIQNANNQLRRMRGLDLVEDLGQEAQESGGVQRIWTAALSNDQRMQLLKYTDTVTLSPERFATPPYPSD